MNPAEGSGDDATRDQVANQIAAIEAAELIAAYQADPLETLRKRLTDISNKPENANSVSDIAEPAVGEALRLMIALGVPRRVTDAIIDHMRNAQIAQDAVALRDTLLDPTTNKKPNDHHDQRDIAEHALMPVIFFASAVGAGHVVDALAELAWGLDDVDRGRKLPPILRAPDLVSARTKDDLLATGNVQGKADSRSKLFTYDLLHRCIDFLRREHQSDERSVASACEEIAAMLKARASVAGLKEPEMRQFDAKFGNKLRLMSINKGAAGVREQLEATHGALGSIESRQQLEEVVDVLFDRRAHLYRRRL